MLSQYIRALYNDNGTINDYSLASQHRTDTIPFQVVAAEDYFYVGQYYPFNNLFIDIDTANTDASVMSIEYWTGSEWVSAVDLLDDTSSGGASIAQSGVAQWAIDKDDSNWTRIQDPTDEGSALGFEALKIYNLYWVRMSFSGDFSADTDLKQIGYKFCSDADLAAIAPDIDDYQASWASGKTDWTDQILEASKHLITDLKSRRFLAHPGQILRFDEVNIPCAFKTLALIYDGIGGEDFLIMRDQKNKKYKELINQAPIFIDKNNNAQADLSELNLSHGRVYR